MISCLRGLVGDYFILFLMASIGSIFIVTAIQNKPLEQVIRSYFWRMILWESAIAPLLWLIRLPFSIMTEHSPEDRATELKFIKDCQFARECFMRDASQTSTEVAQKTWYVLAWLWFEGKVKIACGMAISLLTFAPMVAQAQEETITAPASTTTTQLDPKSTLTTFGSWSGKNFVHAEKLSVEYGPKDKRAGIEILEWNFPTSETTELLYWPRESRSKVGFGFDLSSNNGCHGEINGIHQFPLAKASGYLFWQGKIGLSGQGLSTDRFQINSLKLTIPLGSDTRLGADSKILLEHGKKPVFNIGGVADLKIQNMTLRIRHFGRLDRGPSTTEVWLILPLGGTGP